MPELDTSERSCSPSKLTSAACGLTSAHTSLATHGTLRAVAQLTPPSRVVMLEKVAWVGPKRPVPLGSVSNGPLLHQFVVSISKR